MYQRVLLILTLLSLTLSSYSVWKHIKKDPEEIAKLTLEGMQKIQDKNLKEAQARQEGAIKEKIAEIKNGSKDEPYAGNPEGDVVVLYFFDYRCGYCRRADPVIDELVKGDQNLRVLYKDYPIFEETFASEAALAAHKQGQYVAMHQALMAHKDPLTKEAVLKIAKGIGLDVGALEKQMADPSTKQALDSNRALAEAIGLEGVPLFVVGTTVLPGAVSLDEFRLVIQKEREKAGSTPVKKELPQDEKGKKS